MALRMAYRFTTKRTTGEEKTNHWLGQRATANNSPAKPPPNATHAGFTFHRNNTASATTAITQDGHPRKASPASLNVTPAMSATAQTFTESRNAAIHGDCLSRNKTGASIATYKNEGRKMATVATAAPGGPPRMYPMNVAVDSTGPGVNCPIATASSNCRCVNHPCCRTSPCSRNASNTYPPP